MLDALDNFETESAPNREVSGITADSREVKPGYMFVAVRGVAVDGHKFISKAIENGATTVVCEGIPSETCDSVAYVKVGDAREALGRLASRFYGDPADELTLVGVTGTNGKTTIATLLYEVARLRGQKPDSYPQSPTSSTATAYRPSIPRPTRCNSIRFCAKWWMQGVRSQLWKLAATPATSTASPDSHLPEAFYQPYPRPPRLPQDFRGIPQGQEIIFRRPPRHGIRPQQCRRPQRRRDAAEYLSPAKPCTLPAMLPTSASRW